jgi:hypothetical protein
LFNPASVGSPPTSRKPPGPLAMVGVNTAEPGPLELEAVGVGEGAGITEAVGVLEVLARGELLADALGDNDVLGCADDEADDDEVGCAPLV